MTTFCQGRLQFNIQGRQVDSAIHPIFAGKSKEQLVHSRRPFMKNALVVGLKYHVMPFMP
jgi:hypothetical protein